MAQEASDREKEKRRQEDEAKRKKYPRRGEWHLVTDEELLQLVRSKSTVQVATEFGVSD